MSHSKCQIIISYKYQTTLSLNVTRSKLQQEKSETFWISVFWSHILSGTSWCFGMWTTWTTWTTSKQLIWKKRWKNLGSFKPPRLSSFATMKFRLPWRQAPRARVFPRVTKEEMPSGHETALSVEGGNQNKPKEKSNKSNTYKIL